MIPQKSGDGPVKAIKIINRITIIDGVWQIKRNTLMNIWHPDFFLKKSWLSWFNGIGLLYFHFLRFIIQEKLKLKNFMLTSRTSQWFTSAQLAPIDVTDVTQ